MGGISGSIRASAGVEFINDRFSRVGAFTPSFSAVTPTIGASASFDAEAYLEPKISMDINNVVRGYVETRAAVQFEGSAQGSYTYGNSGSARVDCTVSSSITANIGGELGLNVRGKNIGPRKSLGEKQILDVSRKLWSGSKQVGGGSSFDTMDDEGTFYDEDTVTDNSFNVHDSSYLTLDVAEEDRVDNGVGSASPYGGRKTWHHRTSIGAAIEQRDTCYRTRLNLCGDCGYNQNGIWYMECQRKHKVEIDRACGGNAVRI